MDPMLVKWRKMCSGHFIEWGQQRFHVSQRKSVPCKWFQEVRIASVPMRKCVSRCVYVNECVYACTLQCAIRPFLQCCSAISDGWFSVPSFAFISTFTHLWVSMKWSVCKHTTWGRNPTHIVCSHPVKHTLNHLLWSLFRDFCVCVCVSVLARCACLLSLLCMNFIQERWWRISFLPFSLWKWKFDLCFIIL